MNKLTCDDLMKAHDEGYVKGIEAGRLSTLKNVLKVFDNQKGWYDYLLCPKCRKKSRDKGIVDSYCKYCYDKIDHFRKIVEKLKEVDKEK